MDLLRIAQRAVTELWFGVVSLYEDALVIVWSVLSRLGFRCPHPVAQGEVIWPPIDGSAIADLRCKACGTVLGTVTTQRAEPH